MIITTTRSIVSILVIYFCVIHHAFASESKYCSAYQSCAQDTFDDTTDSLACYGFRSCESCHSSINAALTCDGSLSCISSYLHSSKEDSQYFDVECRGYFSCAMSLSIITGNEVDCMGSFSCINSNTNVSLLYQGKSYVTVKGSQSFLNSRFISPDSYSDDLEENTRNIDMYIYSSFAMYNSIILSNRNNLQLRLYGYYAGYGLTVCATNTFDQVRIDCYGNACFNLQLICADGADCITGCPYSSQNVDCILPNKTIFVNNDKENDYNYEYHNQQCSNYSNLFNTHNEKYDSYDRMVNKINHLIHMYDKEYSILMKYLVLNTNNATSYGYKLNETTCDLVKAFNSSSLYRDKTTVFDGDFLETSMNNRSNRSKKGNICCLANNACTDANFGVNGDVRSIPFGNLYCHGEAACTTLRLINGTKVGNMYAGGNSGAYNVSLGFINMTLCSGGKACENSRLKDGKLLICEGYYSCLNAKITNVNTIVGLGFFSLYGATIMINDSDIDSTSKYEIYLLSYLTASQLEIKVLNNASLNNVRIYCQNSGCASMKTTLYCNGANDIGVQTCGLNGVPQTTTVNNDNDNNNNTDSGGSDNSGGDNESGSGGGDDGDNIDADLSNYVLFLDELTIIIAIVFLVVCVLLIILSKMMHKKRKNMDKKLITAKQMISIGNDDASRYEFGNISIDKKTIAMDSKSSIGSFVDYINGFGKNANHWVILFVAFELYDIFTDIAYLFELKYHGFNDLFILFVCSIILTIIFNICIDIFFLTSEFKNNNSLTRWFYEYNGVITSIIMLLTLTDANMITTVFTSQIFGHGAFYCPVSLKSVNMMQISNIFTIFLQHIPQFTIQIIAIFERLKTYNSIVMSTLIVSAIDIIFGVVKAMVWLVLHVQTKSKKSKVSKSLK